MVFRGLLFTAVWRFWDVETDTPAMSVVALTVVDFEDWFPAASKAVTA